MKKKSYKFSNDSVDYFFDARFPQLKKITDPKATILITDENIFRHYQKKIKGWNTIIIKPGEENKVQTTVDAIISRLIKMQADRKTTLVGVGGGVITDITGFVASVYMRGISFGFVPTTLLGMVDASIGGKNGIDVGMYKNMAGIIRQPEFILHDMDFLSTLPQNEWENGFAEIIKHACIKDKAMFGELEKNTFKKYQESKKSICDLVQRNAVFKTKVVQKDEFERADRRLLNFGHTLGHAIENQMQLSHGRAISVGMAFAAVLSEKFTGFKDANKVARLLLRYDLPTFADFDKQKVFNILKMDKKREKKEINFVLLNKIGSAVVRSIPLTELEKIIQEI